ncbi:MAG: TolC family protein [Rhodothermales bacterium]
MRWFRMAGILLVFLGLSVSSALGQQPARSDTLQILDLPLLLAELGANNPSLQASRLGTEALGTRRRQVSALPDPMVMVAYQPFPVLTARGTQRTQWRVEQKIPYPGKLGLQGDIAALSADISGFETETFAQDLAFQLKQAYYELYRVQQQEALIHAFQDRLRDFEVAAATQYEVGRGMQQAILKAQLERNTLSKRALDLARQRRTVTEMLARLLDRPVAAEPEGGLQITPPLVPALDENTLFRIALQKRPEADALDVAAQRADTQVALARKQFLPDFGVSVTYFDIGAAEVPPSATGRDALALGVSVKVPLQRGRLRARLEESRLRRRQVEARREALETAFQTQIADLMSRLRQEQAQLDLFQDVLLHQAETTLAATLSAYTTGRTDFLNLLDAERMLFTLRTGYEDTLARYLKTTAALERALGVTSLTDIDLL